MSRDDEEASGATEIDALLKGLPVDGNAGENRRVGLHHVGKSLSSFFIVGKKKNGAQHRRANTNIPQAMHESFSKGFDVIVENVQTAAQEVRGALMTELREADRGETFFLETGMMRSLAVLPDDMPELVEEAAKTTGIRIEEEKIEAAGPGAALGPCASLLGAVAAVSSNATAMSLLRGVPPPMKLYWRMTATSAFLLVFVLRIVRRDGWPKLSVGQWMTFGMAVLCFSLHALLFVIAIDYTSIGNAIIYANSQALLLLAGKVFVGEPALWMEGSGAVIAFMGAILCSRDSEGSSQGSEDTRHAILGDLLALGSAVGGVGYLTFAKAVRPHMNVTLFMFLVMFSGSFVVLVFMQITGVPFCFSNEPYYGLFGWINWRPDRVLLEAWIVIVCNVLGTMGFVRAMQHFSNLVIAVATLTEPIMASLIAYELHVGLMPGPLGWIGNFLVAVGTLGVVYPSVDKGQSH